MSVGSTDEASDWVDAATPLAASHSDVVTMLEWNDRALDAATDASLTGTEQMRNEDTIAQNPFYDDDGNPVTPELMMNRAPGGYMEAIGTQLWVGDGHGSQEEWAEKTLGEKCRFIQDYT